jgi:hypothetical protein
MAHGTTSAHSSHQKLKVNWLAKPGDTCYNTIVVKLECAVTASGTTLFLNITEAYQLSDLLTTVIREDRSLPGKVSTKLPTHMAQQVYEHASDHYAEDGWDIVVECWTVEEITEEISNCGNLMAAIAHMKETIRPLYERQQEHDAEAKAGM